MERQTKKTQGKPIMLKSAERALPQYSGTLDLDLLETMRKSKSGERLAARVDIKMKE